MTSSRQNQTTLRADRLKMLRQSRGWSQRELARRCGMSESHLSNYEAGINDPSPKYLKILVETLNVSADYLLGLSDTPNGQLGDTLKPEYRQLIEAVDAEDMPTALNILADLMRRQKG